MILNKSNGLCNAILRETDGKATVYLDGDCVSVHWYGATVNQINRLKNIIANYIDAHMMMQSYGKVRFYS